MASMMKRKDLKDLLDGLKIAIPKGASKHADLWALCLENHLVEREFVEETQMTIIKCSLRGAMSVLSDAEFMLFSKKVEQYVEIVSKLFRRASLVLHFHLLRLDSEKLAIPDLYKQNTTYWKRWLTIGTNNEFPDEESKKTFNKIAENFKDSNDIKTYIASLKHFDQILGHSATTFSTCIINNAWYPLFPKLKRLIGLLLKNKWKVGDDIYTSHILEYIRRPVGEEPEIFKANKLPSNVLIFISKVKKALCAENNTEYLYDDHAKVNMTFTQAFYINMQMQILFKELDARMTALSPTFSVHRAHIRLDNRSLTAIFQELFPTKQAVIDYQAALDTFNGELKKKDIKGRAPHKAMLKDIPKPKVTKKKECTEEEWKLYQEAMQVYTAQVKMMKSDNAEYAAHEAIHRTHVDAQKKMLQSFFRKYRKRYWTFDGSIMTDGVSVSLQFSKTVRYEKKPPPKRQEILKVGTYDKNLSCYISDIDTLIIGLDPGRVNLATIGYVWIHDNGTIEKRYWTLSRGQYYEKGGIKKLVQKKQNWYADLKAAWSELGTTKATTPQEILDYITNYNKIKDKWWDLALKKREASYALYTYAQKSSVLNKFFSDVKKDIKKGITDAIKKDKSMTKYKNTKIVVAYGSAVNTMACTGRGEVAAPISATFKACKQVFGRDNIKVTDESFSTKNDWASGACVEKVYKKFRMEDGIVKESFGHYSYNCKKYPKPKTDENKALLEQYVANRKRKRKPPDLQNIYHISHSTEKEKEEEKAKDLRYPEIRGLQFCPENSMYVDRDKKSSVTIARLAVMKLTSNSRPSAFCHKTKNDDA